MGVGRLMGLREFHTLFCEALVVCGGDESTSSAVKKRERRRRRCGSPQGCYWAERDEVSLISKGFLIGKAKSITFYAYLGLKN